MIRAIAKIDNTPYIDGWVINIDYLLVPSFAGAKLPLQFDHYQLVQTF